jgi:dUTP pyrophosphatase
MSGPLPDERGALDQLEALLEGLKLDDNPRRKAIRDAARFVVERCGDDVSPYVLELATGAAPTRPSQPSLGVKARLLHPSARLPTYATEGASGLDLYAPGEAWVQGGRQATILLGIAIEIPPGFEGQLRPRSGMTKRGIVAMLGTIDSDYRGEVAVTLRNHGHSPYRVEAGDRIAQLVIAPVARVTLVEAAELSETARGAGGHGSTGR